MKFIVVSDNHGDRDVLVDLVNFYEGKVAAFFHCGDSELKSNDPLWQHFTGVVKGNCDFDAGYKEQETLEIGGERIYLTHGHLSDVRFGLTHLMMEAKQAEATLCFFGHTHMLGCEKRQGILFLNPGSISQPRGALLFKCYALIDISDKSYQVTYYDRTHQPIDKLKFLFQK